MKELKGKIAVITGASEGIGRAISISIAKEGSKVILLARGKEKLEILKQEINSIGLESYSYTCDVSNENELIQTMQKIEKEFGRIDILVNNAGVGTFKPLDKISLEELLRPVKLPIASTILATKLVLEGMLKRKEGHIVNLTSPAGYFPLPYMLPYTSARFAVVGFSLGLREELLDKGIGVSLICPSQVNTGYFEKNDANMDWYPKLSKLLPVLEPDEVGKRVVKAIYNNEREVVFPFILWFILRFYQTFPNFGIWFLKVFGLFKPSVKNE